MAGGALLAGVGISYVGAQLLLTLHHGMTTSAGQVIALSDTEVTLPKSAVSERVGTYGLVWLDETGVPSGTATIGPVTSTTGDAVTRPISNLVGSLTVGTPVQLNPNIYNGDPQTSLGIQFKNVGIPGDLGSMPAWQVPGEGSTWMLSVHGGQRESGLRPLPTIVDAGYPTLLITYRNDVGAPPSENGLIGLAQTEWHDLDSAATYAIGQSATEFILYGDSMGGSIVTQFMHRSQYADLVTAMVLDSPRTQLGRGSAEPSRSAAFWHLGRTVATRSVVAR